jgi:lipoprotein-anchoring transpeptidase ErfK/SrfK
VQALTNKVIRRPVLTAATAAAIALLATACSGSSAPTAAQVKASAKGHASQLAAEVRITPADGSKGVNPGNGITVSALDGKVANVTVKSSGGAPVTGTLAADGKTWHSLRTLGVSQTYTVTATATGTGGQQVTRTSTFRTLTPERTFQTQIFEGYHQTYGVGIPIILAFSEPISNKVAVERSMEITTSKPVVGAWYWDGDEKLYFRPRDYWPANTTVSFTGHLDGVEAAPGLYGAHNLTQTFDIGRSLIAVASTTTHYTKIYIDGKLAYNWPISTGRPGLPTPNGTYLTVEKGNPVRMIGTTADSYNELVNFAVRFTYSGDYYHSAPWSVGAQGVTNVSHGCVNLSPAHAETFYNLAVPGDPITVVNSPKAGKWDDGFTEWFFTWSQYLRGSALHQAVVAGPQGSKFVDPSSLPASTATAPLATSAPGNYNAGASG